MQKLESHLQKETVKVFSWDFPCRPFQNKQALTVKRKVDEPQSAFPSACDVNKKLQLDFHGWTPVQKLKNSHPKVLFYLSRGDLLDSVLLKKPDFLLQCLKAKKKTKKPRLTCRVLPGVSTANCSRTFQDPVCSLLIKHFRNGRQILSLRRGRSHTPRSLLLLKNVFRQRNLFWKTTPGDRGVLCRRLRLLDDVQVADPASSLTTSRMFLPQKLTLPPR